MTKAQFTTGPWTTGRNPDSTTTVYCQSFAVADCYGKASRENARLIAAAPELLQAVLDAEQFTRGFEDDESQPSVKWLCIQLRSAIAKARGENMDVAA